MFNKMVKMEEFHGSGAAADNMLGSHSLGKLQTMLVVQDVVKTTKIFGGDGNPSVCFRRL
jgi:hypothetical protein